MRFLNEDEQEEDLRRTMKYPDENKIWESLIKR